MIGHDGKLHNKPRMLSQIDVASRFAIYSEFFVTEDAPHQEIGLRRAVTSHGIPREYYVDGGAAYIAGSLKTICAELGIRLLHAGPGDAEAKGVIERWHRTWRTEVGSELPDRPLHIDQLNEHHVAWVACEYNRRPHGTTGQAPLEHFLAGADNLRPVPLRPGPRAQIVSDIKAALVSLVDEHGVVPIVILDEAQGLRDDLLHELYGLCSLDLDGRDYLTMWLVGHPRLARRLRLKQHSALAQRVLVHAPLVAKTDPALLDAMLEHGLAAAGAPADLVNAEARQLLHRACRGLPRLASQLLRLALLLADEQELPAIDGSVMSSAIALLHLETPSPPRVAPAKPRFDRETKPRK